MVEKDVTHFCQKFMRTWEIPSEVNRAVVCLILKVKVPQNMTDLRPVSLCNVLMRTLSKILSNRLKGCLGGIISDKQRAFIKGRLLTDNALLAFEDNHHMRRRTQ